MAVEKVILTAHDERYAPPERVVELAVTHNEDKQPLLYISVSRYDETNRKSYLDREFDVPVLDLNEVLRAIVACAPEIAACFAPIPPKFPFRQE